MISEKKKKNMIYSYEHQAKPYFKKDANHDTWEKSNQVLINIGYINSLELASLLSLHRHQLGRKLEERN